MGEITRRDLLKASGAGLGLLGGALFYGRLRWSDWLGGKTAQVDGSLPPPLFSHACEAMFYETIGADSLNCVDCHGEASGDSRTLYCHTPHQGLYAKCQLCPHGCVISEGARGHCRVRENRGGRLYSLVFGTPCAVHVDPIEKKPFYHFLPTTPAFSLATAGCNLRCLYCQNWNISQAEPEEVEVIDLPPEKLVSMCRANGATVIAYTYSEPTVFFEYMLESARQGRELGLRSVVVSAGYINSEPLQTLCEVVDAIKIDLKGFNQQFYRDVCGGELTPVLEAIRTIADSGTHLEIVNLVVPTLNDDLEEIRGLCQWIVQNIGPDVPVHFSRFQPQYQLTNLPATPQSTLEHAWSIAHESGIRYSYIGNLLDHPGNNTLCHHCGALIIGRRGFWVTEYHILNGKCEFCGTIIPGVWADAVAKESEQTLSDGDSQSGLG